MYFNSSIGKIYYKKVGHGPHLSFLHGFCEDHSIWNTLCETLKKDYCCILIDLPGFGKSSLDSDASIPDFSKAIAELLNHEEIASTALFGHSMGGYIALEMLSSYPAHINSIGLIHSTAEADSSEKVKSRKSVLKFLKNHKAEDFLKQFYLQLVSPTNLDRLAAQLWDLVKNTQKESIEIATTAMTNRTNHQPTLEKANIPVLFVTGDNDNHFSTESVLHQAAGCERAQVEIIKGSGHLSMLEDEANCLDVFQSFLLYYQQLSSNTKV